MSNNLERRLVFCVFLIQLIVPSFVEASGKNIPDVRRNGWAYPLDYRSWENCYQFGQYDGHVGVDLCRPENTDVFAIADGCVVDYSNSLSSYGSWSGGKGGATLLRHETDTGRIFYAVYGHSTPNDEHLKNKKCDTDNNNFKIKKGDKIATVHPYIGIDGKRSDHLHFGIRPDAVDPDFEYRGNDCTKSDSCGWIDPFDNFLIL